MSYERVIPRDLFNEGNLLKCYGQLYLNLEKMGLQDWLIHELEGEFFQVEQDDADGSLRLANVELLLGGLTDGIPVRLSRPLNSRKPYPLWAFFDDQEIEVFNGDGSFTEEMIALLKGFQ